MNLIFAGTPEFAVPTLEALHRAGHTVVAVYTQPDRPAGRGRQLMMSPVKQAAQTLGFEVRQPENLKGRAGEIAALNADFMIVVAYGVLLPPDVLAAPRLGCLNVHASLLPRWRGAAPIARAIEAQDKITGITIMQMEAGLDTGPTWHKVEIPILPSDTAQSLHDRLKEIGAQALVETLANIERGQIKAEPQDPTQTTYAKKLKKNEARINFDLSAADLSAKIRAFNPWPVALTSLEGKTIRVWEATVTPKATPAEPGTVLTADKTGIAVATGDGVLVLTKLQAEGGKAQGATDFLNGHRVPIGARLG
jgi:methionyl-tRNA formyltransferase